MKKIEKEKKAKYKVNNKFINFLVIFVTVFSLLMCAYMSISMFVYEQFNLHIFYVMTIIIFSCIISLIISFFVKINRISLLIQVSIIYTAIALSIIGLALLFNQLEFANTKFFLITLITSFIGLGLSILFVLLTKKKEEDDLNSDLASFKGRKR